MLACRQRLGTLLAPAQQAVQHVLAVGKDVAGIVKNGKTQVVLEKRQGHGRKAQLQIIHEQRAATQGITGFRVTRSSLIEAKAAMGVAAAGEKKLGQRQALLRAAGGGTFARERAARCFRKVSRFRCG